MTMSRAGRPRASSRETLAEAACELFLERGFEATSIADITQRAGVSRSSFFNYFTGKSAVLWAGFDERIEQLERTLRRPEATLREATLALADGFAPDSLALAMVNAEPMGVVRELETEGALRRARISASVAAHGRAGGADPLVAAARGGAWAGAILAAIEAWAHEGPGRADLAAWMSRAADAAATR